MATTLPIEERKHFERAWGESARWKSRLMLIHPIGVALYVLITFLCAVIASHRIPPGRLLAPLLLAMFLSQSAVGIANEVVDRQLDARTKPWRPMAAGYVTPVAAIWLGVASAGLAVAAAAFLSLPAAALLFCGTCTGVIYSVRLKRSPLSWFPYVVTYPGFALWVWLALGRLPDPSTTSGLAQLVRSPLLPRLLAVYPVMIPMALAAHLCNQLRDYDDDLAQGVRGTVHYLGKRRSLGLCFALLLLGPLPMLLYPLPAAPARLLLAGAALLHWLISLAGIRAYTRHPEANGMRRLFRLLQLTGPLLALTWLALAFW